MGIDHAEVLEAESARVVAALAAGRAARIPWSDDWTVADCAHHVGGVQHWIDLVVRGRPTADWGARAEIGAPPVDDPDLGAWIAAGAASLLEVLRSTDG